MTNTALIDQVMSPAPQSVELGRPLADVRSALASQRFHHVPVVRHHKLVGLISSNDLLAHGLAADNGFLDNKITAADIMQTDVISVNQRATVEEGARKLSAGGFHALPVVDDNDLLVGIVTTTDLINYLLENAPTTEDSPETLSRLKTLEVVLKAAEHYLHSGQAMTQHVRLEKAIADARQQVAEID